MIQKLPIKPVVDVAPDNFPLNVLLALPEYVTGNPNAPLFNLPAAVHALLGDWQRAVNAMNPKVWAPGWDSEHFLNFLYNTQPRLSLPESAAEGLRASGSSGLPWTVEARSHEIPKYDVVHFVGSFGFFAEDGGLYEDLSRALRGWVQVHYFDYGLDFGEGHRVAAGTLRDALVRSGTRLLILQSLKDEIDSKLAEYIVGGGGPAVLIVAGRDTESLNAFFFNLYSGILHNRPLDELTQAENNGPKVLLLYGEGGNHLLQVNALMELLGNQLHGYSSLVKNLRSYIGKGGLSISSFGLSYDEVDSLLKELDLRIDSELKELNDVKARPWNRAYEGAIFLSGVAERVSGITEDIGRMPGEGNVLMKLLGHQLHSYSSLVKNLLFDISTLRNELKHMLVSRFEEANLLEELDLRIDSELKELNDVKRRPWNRAYDGAIFLSNLAERVSSITEDIGHTSGEGPMHTKFDMLEYDLPKLLKLEERLRRPEAERFTDLTLYKGHLFPGDHPAPVNRLQNWEALRVGSKYTLEVAIRQECSGIDAEWPRVRAVLNLRRMTETLTILVVARPLYGPIVIDDRMAGIEWPYNADSSPAFFRIMVPPETLLQPVLVAEVEVRLYHANLDLLDVTHLVVHVTADTGGKTPWTGKMPQRIEWPQLSRAVPRLDPEVVSRELTIRVSPATEGYSFEFIFRRGEREVPLPFERYLKVWDLETLLAKVRDFWTELVTTNYKSQLSVALPTWNGYLRRLYALGTDAWELLFGSRTGSQKGASETMGDLLARMELAAGSHVQVTYDGRLTDFVFPWSILHPPTVPDIPVDPLRFWGARYQIEQVRGGGSQDRLEIEPVGVAVTIDPGFGEAQPEVDMFERFRAGAVGRLDLDAPIANRRELFTALASAPSRHLYYFFCHGYTPAGPSLARRDGIKVLRESLEALTPAERKPWDTLLALTAKMADEPWMFIGNAQITESALRQVRGFFNQRRPILFLNMCHSAALAPSMTRGLLRLFLERDAAAIIGTESPITSVFAHAFANEFFNDLFRGSDIGTALWRARRHFLAVDIRNPLGFVYTLYGRATVRLGSGPLLTASRYEDTSPS